MSERACYCTKVKILFLSLLAEDFDATPLSRMIPAGSTSITFEVHLPQDVVVENEETFVAILEVNGSATLVTRNCTVIRISEFFTGRCKF